jgi:hypothetical protein
VATPVDVWPLAEVAPPALLSPLLASAAPMLKTSTTWVMSAVAWSLSTVTAAWETCVWSRLPTAVAGPVEMAVLPPAAVTLASGTLPVETWLLPELAIATAVPAMVTDWLPVSTLPGVVGDGPTVDDPIVDDALLASVVGSVVGSVVADAVLEEVAAAGGLLVVAPAVEELVAEGSVVPAAASAGAFPDVVAGAKVSVGDVSGARSVVGTVTITVTTPGGWLVLVVAAVESPSANAWPESVSMASAVMSADSFSPRCTYVPLFVFCSMSVIGGAGQDRRFLER